MTTMPHKLPSYANPPPQLSLFKKLNMLSPTQQWPLCLARSLRRLPAIHCPATYACKCLKHNSGALAVLTPTPSRASNAAWQACSTRPPWHAALGGAQARVATPVVLAPAPASAATPAAPGWQAGAPCASAFLANVTLLERSAYSAGPNALA